MEQKKKLPDSEVQEMLEKLQEHFGEPVRPVSHYCSAFEKWMTCLVASYEADLERFGPEAASRMSWGAEVAPFLRKLQFLISKSSLLARLIYAGEQFRTLPCPKHKGYWSGCFIDCPCHGTGWLPEEKEEKKPDDLDKGSK